MSESSTSPPPEGEPFDVEAFARRTIWSIEAGDDMCSEVEDRVIRLEEIVAARWPRSLLLRWRLAREIRASVAGYADSLIPRGDFRGRRLQAASEATTLAWQRRRRLSDEHRGGGEQPGEGLLP